MEIKIKKEEEVIVNVEVPSFYFRTDLNWKDYLAILPDNTCVSVSIGLSMTTITHAPASSCEHKINQAIGWKTILEHEFLEAHEAALQSLSLKPILHEDDLTPLDELYKK
jgi:hypothetical protein